MDVEFHVLPLAKTSKFVTEENKKRGQSVNILHVGEQMLKVIHPPPSPLTHLSMNFWKIFPLKLSQISTMYGCRETDTNSSSGRVFICSVSVFSRFFSVPLN